MPPQSKSRAVLEVLLAFLRLGCTSFGGPIAHLGYFQAELVERRRWCSPAEFSEIVALAQSLPGPASSQTGFALGILRAGWVGGVAAWIGFTLPSAALMLALAFASSAAANPALQRVSHGLQLVAVAVVAQAILSMRRGLAPDRPRFAVALAAAAIVLLRAAPLASLAAIGAAALVGLLGFRTLQPETVTASALHFSKPAGIAAAILFFLPLFLPISAANPSPVGVFAAFYRTGALVFGGGHVVLPLLESTVVVPGWVPQSTFLAGYGAAQALPGPLFAFAAYLGASVGPGVASGQAPVFALAALLGLFTPGLLAVAALLPFWNAFRRNRTIRSALTAINAAVVGLLLAALFQPLWTSSVHTPADFLTTLAAFSLLTLWNRPNWQVVAAVALASLALPL